MSYETIRISELAKELGLQRKEVVEKFAQMGITGKTHSSTVTVDQISRLKDFIANGGVKAVQKPKAFVAENVKGILTANKRKAIQQIIEDFQNIEPGYLVIPHLYNFADYGVPEFRERVLIVGIRIDTGFHFEHPKPTHGNAEGLLPYVTVGDAFKGVEMVPHNNELIRVTERTRTIISLIPEGGNFTSIPKI